MSLEQLKDIEKEALSTLHACQEISGLSDLKVKYLGKSGLITSVLRTLGQMPANERPMVGAEANRVKETIANALQAKEREISDKIKSSANASPAIDITLPVTQLSLPGNLHPITQVMEKIIEIFAELGFSVRTGPEVESDYYNFTALNIAENHPARDMQDTFFLTLPGLLLRTHTSPVQIRSMQKEKPPLRIIAPGAVYRCDADVTHSPMFHQVEALAIDDKLTMADLKGTLQYFAKRMFGEETAIRLRPSFFPFTEPSAEMDISCVICQQASSECRVCGGTGWLEILGAGMVHPQVLRNVGYDPKKVQGFALGLGVERVAMLLYRINDIRLFYDNALPFLKQFGYNS